MHHCEFILSLSLHFLLNILILTPSTTLEDLLVRVYIFRPMDKEIGLLNNSFTSWGWLCATIPTPQGMEGGSGTFLLLCEKDQQLVEVLVSKIAPRKHKSSPTHIAVATVVGMALMFAYLALVTFPLLWCMGDITTASCVLPHWYHASSNEGKATLLKFGDADITTDFKAQQKDMDAVDRLVNWLDTTVWLLQAHSLIVRVDVRVFVRVFPEFPLLVGFSIVSPFGSLYYSFTPFCLRSCLLIKHPWLV